MVSFALLGIIVVVIAGAMRLGFRSVEAGEKKVGALERLRASVAIVNSQIQSHNPLTFDDDGEKKSYFDGQRESLQFSSNCSIWGGQMGYVVVKYEVGREDDGKMKLTASETFIGTEESRETTLFKSMDDIYFEYFYKDPTEETGSWTDTWTDDANIPQKIRLRMNYKDKDFSMIIPVRVSGSPGQPSAPGVQSFFRPKGPEEQ